jgi:hypothetical protein
MQVFICDLFTFIYVDSSGAYVLLACARIIDSGSTAGSSISNA